MFVYQSLVSIVGFSSMLIPFVSTWNCYWKYRASYL